MSLFNKILASVGIGNTQIDTKLEKDYLIQGEKVSGIIEVRGGNVEQQIDSLYLNLHTTFRKEVNDKKYTDVASIGHFLLTESFEIRPNEQKQIPFSFNLPEDTPITYGSTKIWITTAADIKSAVDPTDKDYIKVQPRPLNAAVINAISELGFRLHQVDCEIAPRYLHTSLPIIQEFEFIPYNGPFRGRLDELEIVFYNQTKNSVDVLIEVDRRARGLSSLFAEAFEMDETKVRINLTTNDIPYIKEKLNDVIKRYA